MRRLWLATVFVVLSGLVAAQQPPPGLPHPRIVQVLPVGVSTLPPPQFQVFGLKIETPTLVTVTGTDLDEPEGLIFSHPGIQAKYVESAAAELKGKGQSKRNALAHTFAVTAAGNVPPGTYDVRLSGSWGLSNPRAFVVDRLPEFYEREPNNDVPEAQRLPINSTVNGVFSAGTDIDYVVFNGNAGQRVILSCQASSIDSRAVPQIEVYDSSGRRLAVNRNYQDNDALVDLTLPAAGDYYVRLSQFTYIGGGPDHFYRFTIRTGPWIDAVVPAVIEFGKPATVTIYGRNLPNGQPAGVTGVDGQPLEQLAVTVQPPSDPASRFRLSYPGRVPPPMALLDGFSYALDGPTGRSNNVPLFLTHVPVTAKPVGAATSPDKAHPLPVPGEAAGFIAQRGGSDWYRFDAKKGQVFIIELFAERIGSRGDFYFSVRDGKDPNRDLSGEQDDDNDPLHPVQFYTRSNDPPPFRFVAPEDGSYLVHVGTRDANVVYGPCTSYRLRIAPPQPDFRVIVMPYGRNYQSGSAAWQGGQQAYSVYVHRQHGYDGTVTVTPEGLPPGVSAAPLVIGPQARWGVLVLNVAADAPPFTGMIRLKAIGTPPGGQGAPIERDGRAATIVWGVNADANVPTIARLTDGLPLAVRPHKAIFVLLADTANIKINDKTEKLAGPVRVKPGDKWTLPVKVQWLSGDKQNITLAAELFAPGQQNNPFQIQFPAQPTKDKPEGVAAFDTRPNAAPGNYTLVLRGTAQVPFTHPATKKGNNVPVDAFTPPLAITVLPNALAKVSVVNVPNNQLKRGATAELIVRVERLYGYNGPYQVVLEFPPNTKGLTATPATIPPGQTEVKLPLTAAADAPPGGINNILVVVTAAYDPQYTVRHENKININVVK